MLVLCIFDCNWDLPISGDDVISGEVNDDVNDDVIDDASDDVIVVM